MLGLNNFRPRLDRVGPPRLCVVPGEGAAADAVRESINVLEKLNIDLELAFVDVTVPDWKSTLDRSDACLFGAVADGRELLGYLRWGRQTGANIRPVKHVAGFRSPLKHPEAVDFVIVRENLEDAYPPREGDVPELHGLEKNHPEWPPLTDEGQFAIKVITPQRTRNVARVAGELAMHRKARGAPGRVTIGVKHNVLQRTDGLFREIAMDELSYFPELEVETCIADALFHRTIWAPETLDVVVTPNLLGDLLADAGAALTGGLGVAASACIGADYAYFEPVHGTAPDLVGRNVINPTATLLSAAHALDYLGLETQAASLVNAIDLTYQRQLGMTPDQGGRSNTSEFCAAVINQFEESQK